MALSERLGERTNEIWDNLFNQILDGLLILMNVTVILINLAMLIFKRTERMERGTQTN